MSRYVIHETIDVYDPSPDLVKWCEKNLVLANPEYAKKQRMHLWTGNTPKTISLYERIGDMLRLPYGTLQDICGFYIVDGDKWTWDFGAPTFVNYDGEIPLYDYQAEAVYEMGFYRNGILQAPAGSGKTQMGLSLITHSCHKALWLTHTKDLLTQSKERAEQYLDSSLMGTITEGKVDIGNGITFATVQTMSKLDLSKYKDEWDIIVVDECFPAGTLIKTIDGDMPIELVAPGDKVLTRNERNGKLQYRIVDEASSRPLKGCLVEITLKNGTVLRCTENHPIFTKSGYKEAGDLSNDDEVCCLREGVRQYDIKQDSALCHIKRGTRTSLLKRVFLQSRECPQHLDRGATSLSPRDDAAIKLSHSVRSNEEEQPNVSRRGAGKVIEYITDDSSSSSRSRRKWKRINKTAGANDESTVRLTSAGGVRCSYSSPERGVSNSLQNRHCDTYLQSCNRSGRKFAYVSTSATGGQEENRVPEWVGVDSIKVYQQTDICGLSHLCPDHTVYNLGVKRNHNYFANGVAVHNCHRACGTPTAVTMFSKVLNSLAARFKYGLSATVHRSDGLIQATYALMGRVAYSVPREAVAARVMPVRVRPMYTGEPLTDECLNTDGTLNHTALITNLCERDERNAYILDVLDHEQEHPSLILSDRLSHLEALMSQLTPEEKSLAVMISGKMNTKKGKAEREQAIADMRSGKKRYLFATYSLAKEGLDIPCLERLYLTTPHKDYAVVTQAVGRIARVCKGKTEPVCFDFVDDIPFLWKAWKQRVRIYKKAGCNIQGG